MSQVLGSSHRGINVDSDWVTTFGLIALLVICILMLARDVKNFIWGDLAAPAPIRWNFWNIFNRIFEGVAAVYLFMFAFRVTQKAATIGCGLLGLRLAAFALLSCFNVSPSVRHLIALSGAIISQIALATLCVAIVQWLKTVVRWNSAPDPPGGDR